MIKKIGIALVVATPIVTMISCSTNGAEKDYKNWGDDNFVKDYQNLSYDDEAKGAKLINEVDYSKHTSNTMFQMLVYSFADGNNDGIGDFIGAKEKLGYLKNLGIDEIWLSPIHPASSYHGYDVIDYTDVAPELGGMKAFDEFVKVAHEMNIRIDLDMVFNHTSYEHPWFQEALKNPKSKYRKYYRFEDNNEDFGDTNLMDSNLADHFVNVKGKDGHPPISKVPYISKFWAGMPDLNLDNPDVIKELENIQKFWVKKGIDGFRYDAIMEYYSSKGENTKNNQDEKLKKIFADLREAGEEGAKEVNRNSKFDEFMMAEWWDSAVAASKYFKDGDRRALDSGYDAKHWKHDPNPTESVENIKAITETYRKTDSHAQWTPFLDNHDESPWINDFVAMAYPNRDISAPLTSSDINFLKAGLFSLLTRPAKPIVYYGDILGYHGNKGNGDSNIREAQHWSDPKYVTNFYEKRSGPNEKIQIRSKDRPTVESQIKDPNSIYTEVSQINKWRASNDFVTQTDERTIEDASSYILPTSTNTSDAFIRRSIDGNKKFLVVFSMNHEVIVNFKTAPKAATLLSKGSSLVNNKLVLPEGKRGYAIIEL